MNPRSVRPRALAARSLAVLSWMAAAIAFEDAAAGPTNPNISIIGQPFARITDDPADPDRERLRFDPGEVELVFDDYLNPYAKAFFTLAIGADGLELEEGYFDLVRGLPFGFALRGGQYRVAFGKQNPSHPHTYPFAERFRVLARYLPGEEAYIENGVSLSKLVALPRDRSLTLSVDGLQGDSFRIARAPSPSPDDPLAVPDGLGDHGAETRPAVNGRAAIFSELGELSALELGATVAHGTENVAADARSTVIGADAKAKLWRTPEAYFLLQGEALWLDRPAVSWEEGAGYTTTPGDAFGGYVYCDYNWARRYNAGLGYERFADPSAPNADASTGLRAFAGLALFEETTVFRLDWERFDPPASEPVHTTTLRAIFALGPHKAHTF